MATINTNEGPPVLPGASMLPPMESLEPIPERKPATSKKGKAEKKRNTCDRFAVLNGFVDCSMAGLTKAEALTWLILYRDTRNGTARTSQADIARRAGLSDRSVRSAIAKLVKVGLLIVVFRGGLNAGPSRYRVVPLRKPAS